MFVDTRSMPPKALIVTERLKSVSTIPGLPYINSSAITSNSSRHEIPKRVVDYDDR